MFSTKAKDKLTILAAVSDSKLSKAAFPMILISTYSSIEITQNEKFALNGVNLDTTIVQVVERGFSIFLWNEGGSIHRKRY